ncbi:biosynthetic arginine decarboxylase [Enterobacter cloacae]|uniref:Biosynthetic arginine decarboxylase n=1 Tax=Enterobacter cloacae TaxID=550 RepID=A0A377LSP5_ENTCL|nr:biosynthetic arginine decarboxylase [Enterobacter cloacae]
MTPDGAIDHYVDGDGIATTMPMPEYDPENPPMLGFFMVGAYQEILGNMHNLFGDTEAVDVFVFPDAQRGSGAVWTKGDTGGGHAGIRASWIRKPC